MLATKFVEQRGAHAVHLAIERTCVRQILDLAKHLDTDAPTLGDVVFASPAVIKAEPFLVRECADLPCE
jgi:hypothetical protein